MKEDFLHYIWKHKKFDFQNLKTEDGAAVVLKSVGSHNLHAGPDFFNATINIDGQLWAGNVEIHLKSSDWYAHHHENDPAYDNVILHVVWNHDTDVFRKDNSAIPVLELSKYVDSNLIYKYEALVGKSLKWINCEHELPEVDEFLKQHWLERLYFERLEQKSTVIIKLLKDSKNDWDAVLFKMLTKGFGTNINGEAFFSLANSIDLGVVRKTHHDQLKLEALLFGQASFLDEEIESAYHKQLKKEYHFLKSKFQLDNQSVLPIQFFRLRPNNFPTIRLSQLASLYASTDSLFSKIITLKSKQDFYDLFEVKASSFWDTHYTFKKETAKRSKKLSELFIDLLLINTIIPLQFCYTQSQSKPNADAVLNIIQEIKAEKNGIVDRFGSLKMTSVNAMHSQALIQLKKEYCDRNLCLQCAVGSSLVK
ncbi:DUF2851 family protein [Spongiivirga citrea]|uniref:DUF2851 family protein n=1 Tax=Spongiivirga citrea TaxID=1481457 RepID=A0A6M0CKE4_9FLAO|nr:DUF2851 family protein [Spongiivirga citrea]NER18435.1 DUF2851 family protein [Spongiivirga citrea]